MSGRGGVPFDNKFTMKESLCQMCSGKSFQGDMDTWGLVMSDLLWPRGSITKEEITWPTQGRHSPTCHWVSRGNQPVPHGVRLHQRCQE